MSPLSGVVPSHFNPSEPKVLDSAKLYRACETGDIKEVERLTQDFKEIPNVNGPDGISPLYIACQKGFPDIVRLLIAKKVDVNACSIGGYSPLYGACRNGHEEVAQALIKAGANLEEKNGPDEVAALIAAAERGHVGVIRLLLSEKADVNVFSKGGGTPLYFACQEGHEGAAQVLIEAGAKIEEKNGPNECTALFIAVANGHVGVIRLLLSKKADVNTRSEDGFTPFYFACQEGHEGTAQVLIEAGAKIEEKNGPNERTALFIAAAKGHVGVIRLLLSKNAEVNVFSKDGFTPLYFACQNGREGTARLLLDAGADVNEKNGPDEWTALHVAAANEHVSVIRLLLSKKADIHTNSKDGCTPLYATCHYGQEKAVQVLIEAGTAIDEKHPVTNRTALQNATSRGNEKIVTLLLELGATVYKTDGRISQAVQDAYFTHQQAGLVRCVSVIESGQEVEDQHLQLFLKTVGAQVTLRQMFPKAPSEELSEKIESTVSAIQKNEIKNALFALDIPLNDPDKAVLTILKTLSMQKVVFEQPEPNSFITPDCIPILISRKFEELIDSEVKVLKDALANAKSTDEVVTIKETCKKIVAHLHDIKSLHAKVFQEAFRADFCKRINMQIAQFQTVQESCASGLQH